MNCNTGKVRYADKVSASVAMRRTRERRHIKHEVPAVVSVYLCPLCDGWHMSKLYRPVSKVPKEFRPDRQWQYEARA